MITTSYVKYAVGTDIIMAIKPTYFLLMWKGHDVANFCELDTDEWVNVEQHPQEYQIFVVDGQAAKVFVATWERSLKWAEALKTASSFVFGAYEKITVDLDKLTGKIEAGEQHGINVHPPY